MTELVKSKPELLLKSPEIAQDFIFLNLQNPDIQVRQGAEDFVRNGLGMEPVELADLSYDETMTALRDFFSN